MKATLMNTASVERVVKAIASIEAERDGSKVESVTVKEV